MASCLDELQIKYQGQTFEKLSQSTTSTIIYQGSEELCRRAQKEEFQVGFVHPEYGAITKTAVTQQERPLLADRGHL